MKEPGTPAPVSLKGLLECKPATIEEWLSSAEIVIEVVRTELELQAAAKLAARHRARLIKVRGSMAEIMAFAEFQETDRALHAASAAHEAALAKVTL